MLASTVIISIEGKLQNARRPQLKYVRRMDDPTDGRTMKHKCSMVQLSVYKKGNCIFYIDPYFENATFL